MTVGSRDEKAPSREAFSVFCTSCTSTTMASSDEEGSEEWEADGGEQVGALGPQVRGNGRGMMCGGVGCWADLESRSTAPAALKILLFSDAAKTPAVKHPWLLMAASWWAQTLETGRTWHQDDLACSAMLGKANSLSL